MNYNKVPILPIELVSLIMSFIDMTTPSAQAFNDRKIREVKDVELFSNMSPGILVLEESNLIEQDWEEFLEYTHSIANDSYWEGFYDSSDL